MEKIVLLTEDKALRSELKSVLLENMELIVNRPAPINSVIFFDLDTLKAGRIRDLSDENLVIAVTRQKKTDSVMEAAAYGAYETMHRPLAQGEVHEVLAEVRELAKEKKHSIPVTGPAPVPTCAIVGHSPVIMNVCKKLARLSQVDVPVLVTGETGTGKELIAETIAQLSSRFGKPFVVVNCAAVPEALLESELFGFEKGSFTGAYAAKEGILKIADEGTVFFDEVGELPPSLQGKLLRFLQTQAFYPLGSTKEVQVNVRVISATNRDLAAMVRDGTFREDLYHRLRVASVNVPPLREHREDILPLVHFFINRYKHTGQRAVKGITRAFLKRLLSHEWPGNTRELENVVRSAIALGKTHYLTTHELRELRERPISGAPVLSQNLASVLIPYLKTAIERDEKNLYEKIHNEVDKPLLDYVLSHAKENQSEAARILGINRLTLRKKLKY
jgi:DNA-binding NtrC family response regulator